MKRKVRIKSLPQGYHVMPDGTVMKDSAHMAEGGSVNKNLSPVPRGMANLEAERGEVAMTDLGSTGMMGLYEIGGERHSNGGTPLNLDPGSFIYSDTRKMKIKDPDFLAKYGKSKPTTPAKLVKPFLKMNDFTNTLYDQDADLIQKRTAQTMIDNYKKKAGEIAFYQEGMKGFPQGIPAVAADYAEGIMGAPMAAYGGYILPKAENGQQFSTPSILQTQVKGANFPSWFVEKVASENEKRKPNTPKRKEKREDKFLAINPTVLKLMQQLGMTPKVDQADFSDEDRLNYSRIQDFVPGYSGVYEDAERNFPGWMKRMEGLGYDFSDWKDEQGNVNLKSLKREDPRVRNYQEWWNTRVEQFIQEDEENRLDAGYTALSDQEKNDIRSLKFFDLNDPNAQPGSKIDSKLGTYVTTRFLPEGEYQPQRDTVYFCVDGQVMGQSVRPGTQPQAPSGTDVKGPFKSEAEAQQVCSKTPDKTTKDDTSKKPSPERKLRPFEQDVRNLEALRKNRMSERRRYPWGPQLPYDLFDAVYPDDTRQQQQIAGRAKGSMDALGAFAGPSRQLSAASLISGQAGEQAANVASTMGNQIIGIANQTGQLNQRAISDVNRANALLSKSVYDDTVKTDEIFDEKMRRYRINDALLSNRLLDNMYRADTYNKMNPLYQITPDQGRYYNTGNIELMPGVSAAMFDYENYTSQSQAAENARKANYETFIKDPNLTPEDRSELTKQYYSSLLGGGSGSSQSTGTRSRKRRDDELAALDELRQRQQLAEMYGVDPRSVYPGGYYDPSSFGI